MAEIQGGMMAKFIIDVPDDWKPESNGPCPIGNCPFMQECSPIDGCVYSNAKKAVEVVHIGSDAIAPIDNLKGELSIDSVKLYAVKGE